MAPADDCKQHTLSPCPNPKIPKHRNIAIYPSVNENTTRVFLRMAWYSTFLRVTDSAWSLDWSSICRKMPRGKLAEKHGAPTLASPGCHCKLARQRWLG